MATQTNEKTQLVPGYNYTIQDAIDDYNYAQTGYRFPNPDMPHDWDDLEPRYQDKYLTYLRNMLEEKLQSIDMISLALDAVYRVQSRDMMEEE